MPILSVILKTLPRLTTLLAQYGILLAKKVPSQTDRLVIDLSYTDLTADGLKEYLSGWYVKGHPLVAELKEVIVIKHHSFIGTSVQAERLRQGGRNVYRR